MGKSRKSRRSARRHYRGGKTIDQSVGARAAILRAVLGVHRRQRIACASGVDRRLGAIARPATGRGGRDRIDTDTRVQMRNCQWYVEGVRLLPRRSDVQATGSTPGLLQRLLRIKHRHMVFSSACAHRPRKLDPFASRATHTTPALRNSAISAGVRPAAVRIASVSAPMGGAGWQGVSSPGQLIGEASRRTGPEG
jgi:hypothetical protein